MERLDAVGYSLVSLLRCKQGIQFIISHCPWKSRIDFSRINEVFCFSVAKGKAWRSVLSPRFPPMWLGFDSGLDVICARLKFAGSLLCSEIFFLCALVFIAVICIIIVIITYVIIVVVITCLVIMYVIIYVIIMTIFM